MGKGGKALGLLPGGVPTLGGGPCDLTVPPGQPQPGQNVVQQGLHSSLVRRDRGAGGVLLDRAPVHRQAIRPLGQGDGVTEVVQDHLPGVLVRGGPKARGAPGLGRPALHAQYGQAVHGLRRGTFPGHAVAAFLRGLSIGVAGNGPVTAAQIGTGIAAAVPLPGGRQCAAGPIGAEPAGNSPPQPHRQQQAGGAQGGPLGPVPLGEWDGMGVGGLVDEGVVHLADEVEEMFCPVVHIQSPSCSK